jgi:hypothetical protein
MLLSEIIPLRTFSVSSCTKSAKVFKDIFKIVFETVVQYVSISRKMADTTVSLP